MAGHSRWANIKHKKAKSDAKRGKRWSKCARAIIVAARNGGGDPTSNLTLRYAIDEAKAANMPKDTITNAIKKGTGELASESYESIIYEGYAPRGVAIMLEILTDNRNRTAPEIKRTFEKGGGNLGTSGCVTYVFHQRGQIFVHKNSTTEDTLMSAVLDAGAEDVTEVGTSWQVLCEPPGFDAVRDAIRAAGIEIESAEVTMVPTTTVMCTGDDARRVLALLEALEDHDDVQKVHSNLEIPEEDMAKLGG
jgi:YebC/PmpR family DNA-binding regulatory protein